MLSYVEVAVVGVEMGLHFVFGTIGHPERDRTYTIVSALPRVLEYHRLSQS